MDMNELADKFLNDSLNENERKQFEELLKNPQFVEAAYLNILLKQSFRKNDGLQFLRVLKEVEQIHYYERTYTLEELLAFFTPIEEYEKPLSTITRTGELQLLHPQNHINCVDSLYFEWESPLLKPILLIIENNEYDVLIRREIPAQTISISIPLSPQKGFKAGRYYWKTASTRHQVDAVGVFFIGKDLMPQN